MTSHHLPSPHLFPLASAPPGCHVRIVRFEAGRALFVPGQVPWIRLTPRADVAANHVR